MNCRGYGEWLSRYLDDALSPRQDAGLREHLECCPACAAKLARYRQMDLALRRLPNRPPPPPLRELVLARATPCSSSRSYSAPAPARLVLLVAMLFFAFAAWLTAISPWRELRVDQVVQRTLGQPGNEAKGLAVASESEGTKGQGEDAAVLQQVRRTVDRPGFRPVLPAYLPREARLHAVKFGRNGPGGPIDRLEVAYSAGGSSLRLQQLAGPAAEVERKRLETQRWVTVTRLVVKGREWVYLRRADPRKPEGILIGQRDGLTIWLESALSVEELARVAASLDD